MLLTKTIGRYDFISTIEVHRSFEKFVNTSQINGRLKPGWGTNFGFGGGYNWSSWRLGGNLIWTYEDPIDIEGNTNSKGTLERYATAIASVSYMANDDWAGTLSYTDQTLVGSPVNTSLGRGAVLQIQRRWGR